MSDIQFFSRPGDVRIAFRHTPAERSAPTLVFLPGYMSDMDGGKASALYGWAQAHGHGCLLLDYSGCGRSDGQFADGTLTRWRDEVLALIEHLALQKAVLVGSSMGGWLMLMIGLALVEKWPGRLAAMVGIASAPDFTNWGRSSEDKDMLAHGETVFDENPYGPEPTPMHPGFWRDGQDNLLLRGEIGIDCPVRLLHGQRDADVPWDISMQLANALRSGDVQVTLIKDGDHRLSRDCDIQLLISQVENILK